GSVPGLRSFISFGGLEGHGDLPDGRGSESGARGFKCLAEPRTQVSGPVTNSATVWISNFSGGFRSKYSECFVCEKSYVAP
ncbi:MAG: hypothetical protein WAM39_17200, partial [Bryobacteraceae bacterium]